MIIIKSNFNHFRTATYAGVLVYKGPSIKVIGTLQELACYPCAGAMLIFLYHTYMLCC